MKKINKSVLFKLAWNLKKTGVYNTFSESLKAAWVSMKEAASKIRVKSWFMQKNFTQNERYAIDCARSSSVQKETEKAVLVKWSTKFGSIDRWIPKSCLA